MGFGKRKKRAKSRKEAEGPETTWRNKCLSERSFLLLCYRLLACLPSLLKASKRANKNYSKVIVFLVVL